MMCTLYCIKLFCLKRTYLDLPVQLFPTRCNQTCLSFPLGFLLPLHQHLCDKRNGHTYSWYSNNVLEISTVPHVIKLCYFMEIYFVCWPPSYSFAYGKKFDHRGFAKSMDFFSPNFLLMLIACEAHYYQLPVSCLTWF